MPHASAGDATPVSAASMAAASAAVPAPGTVAAWLDHLEPPPPPALRARLHELLAPHATRPASDVPAACLAAGETRLATLLTQEATDRASALDLLAVDALVTYAFEAASTAPDGIEQLATDAMRRIAEIPEAP